MSCAIFISVFPCTFMLFELMFIIIHVTVHQEVAATRWSLSYVPCPFNHA